MLRAALPSFGSRPSHGRLPRDGDTLSRVWSGLFLKGISTHYRQRVDVPDTRFAGTDRIRMHCALEARSRRIGWCCLLLLSE